MIALYIVIGLFILFAILWMIGPREYKVDRSLVVNRNRQEIYDYVRRLENQDNWGPWSQRDPNMEKSTRGADGEIGFISSWRGNKQVGEGEQEITRLVPNERVETALRFFKPWKSQSDAFIHLEDEGENATRVTWGFKGENNNAMSRVMGVFVDMDKAVGKDFEEGLHNLKKIMEQE
ncbi:MAG: SRPBCC family protein [Saprospiraceae bacterium]|nr:SRPBCC family protein [Saprospiraceae bacterium]